LPRITEALRFLNELGMRGDPGGLTKLNVRDIDGYVQWRCAALGRRTIQTVTSNLRIFLRYLYESGATVSALDRTVIGPRIYAYEDIPSALRPADVEKVLEVTGRDLSAIGRRDYAMLMLLSTYGLRSGEVTALRLEDLDWRREVIRIRHAKTGTHSELPLLRACGEAILRYLQKGRPRSAHREVFLRACAPYQAFARAASFYSLVQRRLTAAGVTPPGKKGPHAFRHARAVGLLRASVPLKEIGDVLGHRSARSTGAYLKLATEDLRAVGLDVPSGVSP